MTTTTREQLFQAIEPAVFHHTDQEELERALTRLEAIIDAACTEARQGEVNRAKAIADQPFGNVKQYLYVRFDELSRLQSGKDEVTHE